MNKLAMGLRLTGGVLMASALLLTAWNLWEGRRAAQQTQTAVAAICQVRQQNRQEETFLLPQAEDYQLPVYEEFPQVEMPVITAEGIDYIGTLEIPSQALSLSVIDTWSYPNLKKSPCRYSGSVYTKDLILCAHNYAKHFGCLASLAPGTEICFTDCDGNLFTYEVAEMVILQPEQLEAMQEGDWDLTLFTCTVGGSSRVTVRCRLTEAG